MNSTKVDGSLTSLEKAASERKERLLKLKKRTSSAATETKNSTDAEPPLKFRNFEPKSETLLSRTDPSSLEKDNEDDSSKEPLSAPTVEKMVEGITEAVIADQKIKMNEDVNLTNLAPTKPNWDLKRDVEKKLAKLEQRTQVKIHEIVRDRIKAQNFNSVQNPSQTSGEEFVAAMNAQIDTEQKSEDEEE